MGLFCGKKCECKRRCKGWFGAMPDIERQCKNACKTHTGLTKDEFLCSGNWIDQQIMMAAYGYDPCQDDDNTIDDFLDPLNNQEKDEAELDQVIKIFMVVLLVGAVLGAIYFFRK